MLSADDGFDACSFAPFDGSIERGESRRGGFSFAGRKFRESSTDGRSFDERMCSPAVDVLDAYTFAPFDRSGLAEEDKLQREICLLFFRVPRRHNRIEIEKSHLYHVLSTPDAV